MESKEENGFTLLAKEQQRLLGLAVAQHAVLEEAIQDAFQRLSGPGACCDDQLQTPPAAGIKLAVASARQPSSVQLRAPDALPEEASVQHEVLQRSPSISEGSEVSSAEEFVPPVTGGRTSTTSAPGMGSTNVRAAAAFAISEMPQTWCDRIRGRIVTLFDYLVGPMVFLNSLVLLLELQIEGGIAGASIGMDPAPTWSDWAPALRTIDSVFVFVFAVELIIRVVLDRRGFVRDVANWFDGFIVVAGLANLLIAAPMLNSGGDQDQSLMRLVRVIKSLRSLRMLRSFRFVRGLRLLVMACQCFLPSLCWSMVLLGIFMSMGGLALGNLLMEFVMDDAASLEDRQWIWLRYGTAYRALYTLYEITFAGNWPTNVRPVLEKVSHVYVIFFVLYVTVIVFAVIRVITAIFLKDTLDAAHNDAENLILDKMRKKAEYVGKLEAVFQAIDKCGDGMISEERLTEILSNPKVAAYFQTLELDVHESRALFHILDNGDGEVTREEFIDGILRCKGGARAIDQIQMHADLRQLDKKVVKLVKSLQKSDVIKGKRQSVRGELKRAQHLKVFHFGAGQSKSFHPLA